MHSIRQRLESGQQVNIFSVGSLPSFKIIEMVASVGGYHGIWIDQEHASLSQQQIELLAMACRSVGLDSYVRVAPTDYATIMRPMEAGVGGIMAAQIRTIDQVRQIVDWSLFPPLGSRGLNPSNFEGDYAKRSLAEIVEKGNRERWLSIQIETVEALEAVDAIAGIPGVDHLFVGPSDLSVALGVPGQFLHQKCQQALERISAASRNHGKSWGILVRSAEHAQLCQSLGCQLFAIGNDLAAVQQGLKVMQQTYSNLLMPICDT